MEFSRAAAAYSVTHPVMQQARIRRFRSTTTRDIVVCSAEPFFRASRDERRRMTEKNKNSEERESANETELGEATPLSEDGHYRLVPLPCPSSLDENTGERYTPPRDTNPTRYLYRLVGLVSNCRVSRRQFASAIRTAMAYTHEFVPDAIWF